MPESPDFDGGFDKPRIIATLNRAYGMRLELEALELAIARGFTSWETLWLESATFLAALSNARPAES
jgi:hypothetical protein